ncbi:MAG: tellurite resistance TerB family protein [Alphaproteobacteria bacterium]|jgi:tellurite resistance protein|nr:tellurite resistance TerB family protein [Alphaproteobacteria bacterium]
MSQHENTSGAISHHTALIYVMVLVSAADRDMTDAELLIIGQDVQRLPVFRSYDIDMLPHAAADCAAMLGDEEGLETILGIVKAALPEKLVETAYALACDVAVADGKLSQEELRLLEMLRYTLKVGRLPAAAIERGARARSMVF